MMQRRSDRPIPGYGGRSPSRGPRKLPSDYLVGGYFAKDYIIRDRLIVGDPKEIVDALTSRDLQDKPLEYSQLRKFFSFVRQMEYRLSGGEEEEWDLVRRDILRLDTFAADAVSRQVAPRVFHELMKKNCQLAVASKEAFLSGFLIHFESIVALYPRKGQR